MRLFSLLTIGVAVMSAISPAGAKPAQTTDDPYIWMEEIEGARALAWVHAHNDETLKVLKGDPSYESDLAAATTILTAQDRIPYGSIAGGQVYNFWQDDVNVRGLWRRASVAEYEKAQPQWETLLDLGVEGRAVPAAEIHPLLGDAVARRWRRECRARVRFGNEVLRPGRLRHSRGKVGRLVD